MPKRPGEPDPTGTVLFDKVGAVAHLVLNRPEKGNALPFGSLDLLVELLHEAEEDDDVKVVVLRGNGRSFCVGDDFEDIARAYGHQGAKPGHKPPRASQRQRLAIDRRLGRAVYDFQHSAKPVIAQVHGHCVGIGMYLVEVADLAICADSTRFSHAEQRLGLAGNTFNLATLIVTLGPKKARELLLLGEPFDGPTAERIGIVNRSVTDELLDDTVAEWAEKVGRNAKDALVMGKAAHNVALSQLGMGGFVHAGMVAHALGTNVKFDEDDFNFFRARRDGGTRAAFEGRDAHHEHGEG
ncbi:MAG: enoyl-CoA hydratase/isomerase family protein [Acidimicrobiia bacterium]|nr:enoyl-CoA hydratase/isomerase family protein [Acidimicrobiia bacterium]